MKIIKSLVLASVLSASALSLSGCTDAARSASAQTAESYNYWSTRVGQKCTVQFSNKAGTNTSRVGVLKSATNSWVVIGDIIETDSVNGKDVGMIRDYCIPTENISYVSFAKPQNGK